MENYTGPDMGTIHRLYQEISTKKAALIIIRIYMILILREENINILYMSF
jgi:hypothetical protein